MPVAVFNIPLCSIDYFIYFPLFIYVWFGVNPGYAQAYSWLLKIYSLLCAQGSVLEMLWRPYEMQRPNTSWQMSI